MVPAPEAERVVGRHRARLDAASAAGVPAHVTVLLMTGGAAPGSWRTVAESPLRPSSACDARSFAWNV
jgi:hypothetical protein